MPAPEVAIVVSPREWAERLHRFVADHGGARVRARILDGREAIDEGYQVLVAEDLTSFLTPRLMDELRRSGRRVLGVYDPVEPWGRERLGELGVDDTIEATASPEQFLRAVDALALTAHVDLDAELERLGTSLDRGGTVDFATDTRSSRTGGGQRDRRHPGGWVTAVGGPSGAPGATEIAIGLAHASARRGWPTVLVDADEVVPSVAQRLGSPLHPNIRTAIDVVEHWSGQLTDTLLPVRGGAFDVLCGLPNVHDWSELRPGEVVDVLTELAAIRTHVVVNVGHRVEELGGVGGTSRYGVTRAVLTAADTLVGVAAATPVGLARYLDWIADVRSLTRAPVHTVIDRAPSSAFKRGELAEELRRTYAPPALYFVPTDRRVADAEWAGELVAHGPFTKALDRIAADVLDAQRSPRREVSA
jgi:hypothetical protein